MINKVSDELFMIHFNYLFWFFFCFDFVVGKLLLINQRSVLVAGRFANNRFSLFAFIFYRRVFFTFFSLPHTSGMDNYCCCCRYTFKVFFMYDVFVVVLTANIFLFNLSCCILLLYFLCVCLTRTRTGLSG